MGQKLSDEQWAEIKEAWETTVASKNSKGKQLAKEYGLHPNTIEVRARNEGWHNPTDESEMALEKVREAVDQVAPDWMDAPERAAMQAEILRLERELASAKQTVDDLRPDTDVTARLFDSVEDVERWLGYEHLEEIAMDEMAQVNKQRVKRGHNPIEITVTREQVMAEARKILAERRNGVGPGPYSRSLKMVAPNRDCGCNGYDDEMRPKPCYRHGNLVSIPFEPQVNNMKGSLYDATERYVKKGFKLTNPLICFAGPCNEQAAIDERGKPIYGGYCTARHRDMTPAEKNSDGSRTVLGTITRESVMA
ncbi:MAG: hypothetical protein OEW91_10700 [Acidimicrobiia bacterium]|nr:hypothetical protein [Acidimicrobiia bacterium]